MLDNITVQNTTPVSKYATTSERVISTTIVAGVVVVVAVMLSFPLWMFSLRALGASDEMLDKAEGFLWLAFLLVPISSAGSLLAGAVQVAQCKSVTHLAGNVGVLLALLDCDAHRIGSRALCSASLATCSIKAQQFHQVQLSSPWVNLLLAGEIPGLILYIVLLALLTSGIGLGSALYFARWDKVREAHLPSRGWLEFLLVLGCATVAALLTGLAFVYLTMLSLIPLLASYSCCYSCLDNVSHVPQRWIGRAIITENSKWNVRKTFSQKDVLLM